MRQQERIAATPYHVVPRNQHAPSSLPYGRRGRLRVAEPEGEAYVASGQLAVSRFV